MNTTEISWVPNTISAVEVTVRLSWLFISTTVYRFYPTSEVNSLLSCGMLAERYSSARETDLE